MFYCLMKGCTEGRTRRTCASHKFYSHSAALGRQVSIWIGICLVGGRESWGGNWSEGYASSPVERWKAATNSVNFLAHSLSRRSTERSRATVGEYNNCQEACFPLRGEWRRGPSAGMYLAVCSGTCTCDVRSEGNWSGYAGMYIQHTEGGRRPYIL